jgi:hypothetical protein
MKDYQKKTLALYHKGLAQGMDEPAARAHAIAGMSEQEKAAILDSVMAKRVEADIRAQYTKREAAAEAERKRVAEILECSINAAQNFVFNVSDMTSSVIYCVQSGRPELLTDAMIEKMEKCLQLLREYHGKGEA